MKKIILFSSAALLSMSVAFSQSIEITPTNQTITTNSSEDDIAIKTSTGSHPRITGINANGTFDTPEATILNRELLRIAGKGYDGSIFTNARAQISFLTNQTWSVGANGTRMTFSTTADGSDVLSERMRITDNGRLAVGLTNPGTTFEVASATSNNGINISSTASGFGSGRLSFWSDRNTGNEWRPGYIKSGDNGSFTGRLDFYTNGTGAADKIGDKMAMSIVDAQVGIGTTDPQKSLHVKGGDVLFEDTTPFLEFRNTGNSGANGIKFANETGSTKGLITYTPITTVIGVMKIAAAGSGTDGLYLTDGKVGLNEDEPEASLHIRGNSTPTTPHLRFYENNNGSADNITFENFDVTANWLIKAQANDTPVNANFKIKTSSAEVVTFTGDGNTEHHGFTQLGDTAPKIKMKKITGTTNNSLTTFVAHGLTRDKILAVDIHVSNGNGVNYPPSGNGLASADDQFRYYINSTNIVLASMGTALQGQSYWILITYEE